MHFSVHVSVLHACISVCMCGYVHTLAVSVHGCIHAFQCACVSACMHFSVPKQYCSMALPHSPEERTN